MGSVDLQDKIIRRMEILGEAINNLPDDLKKAHPEIPWRDMAGIGISWFTSTSGSR